MMPPGSSSKDQKLDRKPVHTQEPKRKSDADRQRGGLQMQTQAAGSLTAPWRGLNWVEIGSSKPESGAEIKNSELAEALQHKRELRKAELDKFMVSDLHVDSYVLVQIDRKMTHFKPDGAMRGAVGGIMKAEGDDAPGAYKVVKGVNFNIDDIDQPVPSGPQHHHRASDAKPSLPPHRSPSTQDTEHASRHRNSKQCHNKKENLSLFETR
jgi:hypothetical protein